VEQSRDIRSYILAVFLIVAALFMGTLFGRAFDPKASSSNETSTSEHKSAQLLSARELARTALLTERKTSPKAHWTDLVGAPAAEPAALFALSAYIVKLTAERNFQLEAHTIDAFLPRGPPSSRASTTGTQAGSGTVVA
jgi:hypothetical protein